MLPGISAVETTYVQNALDYDIDCDWLANVNLGYTSADYGGSTGSGPQRGAKSKFNQYIASLVLQW